MYVVRFKGRHETIITDWKPMTEDDYVVGDATARDRFRRLLQAGMKGQEIDGVVPWFITIVDVSGSDRSGTLRGVSRTDEPIAPDKRVRLAQYAERGSVAYGPWADQALAA
jgi:hypothetical protein